MADPQRQPPGSDTIARPGHGTVRQDCLRPVLAIATARLGDGLAAPDLPRRQGDTRAGTVPTRHETIA